MGQAIVLRWSPQGALPERAELNWYWMLSDHLALLVLVAGHCPDTHSAFAPVTNATEKSVVLQYDVFNLSPYNDIHVINEV